MFDLTTLNDVLVRATGRGDRTVMMCQDADGAWKPISSVELYGRVRALADVFRGWGVGKGDRVVILSENRWEWAVTDFATLAIGGGGCAALSDADARSRSAICCGIRGRRWRWSRRRNSTRS